MSSTILLNLVPMSAIPVSSAGETVLDNDDMNLLTRMLDRAGYDQAAEPKLFVHAAAQILSLFDSGIRHETILMAALQNAGDYPGVADPYVKRRFAIQGLPPGNTAQAV
ncbi:hypothetical protein FHT82_006082 [Rhizobium sp. BK275]|uniref:hypothetical protein n=1 Tax=Rhizobium sp. BK275 TaxID=2587077 RepID=UPI00160E8C13|nr:hypothetical protein [Rhizobium sp. BK275]MBB3393288.1 hypothetical protein [Rhizobium sp. BK275]